MPLFCALFGIVLTYAAKKKGEKRMKKIIELRNISKAFGDETVPLRDFITILRISTPFLILMELSV